MIGILCLVYSNLFIKYQSCPKSSKTGEFEQKICMCDNPSYDLTLPFIKRLNELIGTLKIKMHPSDAISSL